MNKLKKVANCNSGTKMMMAFMGESGGADCLHEGGMRG